MPEWFLILCEVVIFVCGAGAALCLNMGGKWAKWGSVIGLISQPFWAISSWRGGSYGIFGLVAIYSVAYSIGIYNFWFKKKTNIKGKKK